LPLSYLALGLFTFAAGFAVARHRYAAPDQIDRRYDTGPIDSAETAAQIPWTKVIFSGAWLCIWTFGILAVWGALLQANTSPSLFLICWLIAAKIGWIVVARQILGWLNVVENVASR